MSESDGNEKQRVMVSMVHEDTGQRVHSVSKKKRKKERYQDKFSLVVIMIHFENDRKKANGNL